MGITYHEQHKIFQLDTAGTSYLIGLVDNEQFVGHIYYGQRLRAQDARYLLRTEEMPYVPSANGRERCAFLDSFPMEYSGNGVGDYRESCIAVRTQAGHTTVMPVFSSFEILDEKPKLPGLPSAFAGEDAVQTLVLHLSDPVLKLRVDLLYSVFEKEDVITRSVRVYNEAKEPVCLTKVLSACIDMDDDSYDLLTLHGSWARERQIERKPLRYGRQGVGSRRGESSHQEHPFIAWMTEGTTQTCGEVYAMHFVYSGNFTAQIEKTQHDAIRAVMGIHPEDFSWKLEEGACFTAPEVVLTFSEQGLGAMTRSLHAFYRNHMIRGAYTHRKRPILLNNWEATYFDFDTEKLLEIAGRAAELGIEMLVMDDGWFGKRNDDNTSLGDWYVNEEKLPGGLKPLVDGVNRLGMKFGIWMEPEMISPESELYRRHPDWAIQVPGRTAALSRNQYVLDFGRQEVRDHIYEQIRAVLESANIEYVKWDMNRQLSDLGSFALGADRQGELCHRYVLGVYELQERLIHDFPQLLLENCSGGGARFDPGMLYYSPQIWCSDDTDAVERLGIQEGTALIYPLSAIGAHVSDCPNHAVGRVTPFSTRGHVALAGTFGYELDVTKIPKEDQEMIPKQVAMYHKYNDLVREGDYYRIASYRENHSYDCYMVVSQDQSEALVTYVQVIGHPNARSRHIRLQGLDAAKSYRLQESGEVYGGDLLMQAGLPVEPMWGDAQSRLYHLVSAEGGKVMAKSVKLADIAEVVGVSTVTVSKALSDQKGVSEELRTKIKQLAQEMGYTPPAAKKTRQALQYNIGVLIQEMYLDKYASFYWQLYQDLTRRTLMRGCFTMLELVSRNDVMGCHMPIMAKEHRVDGIVVIGSMETHYIQELEDTAGVPVVYMDYYDNTRPIDTVISNSFYGSYMLTNYLFEMGHWEIGYVGTLCATNSITDRYLGYVKALMEHRVPVRDEWVFADRDILTGTIDLDTKMMRLPKQLPTAFVCNSDLTAAHLIKFLERRDYQVPKDFSVVGFDNYLYPGLCDIGITTYEVDISEMARKTFQKLLKRMENEKSKIGTVIVDGRLVLKDSVIRR